MRPSPALFVFFGMALVNVVQGQNIDNYHLRAGICAGDRYMDMAEVNYRYGFAGLGPIPPDRPNEQYSYDGKVKPYHNVAVFSGFIIWKPYSRDNGLNISCQYDYIPKATRKVTITDTYDIEDLINNVPEGTITIKYVDPGNFTIRTQTFCAVVGYDFPFRKILFDIGLGLSYNTFRIAGTSSGTSYDSYRQDSEHQGPEYYPPSYGVYGKASGLGFLIRFSASYPLTKRLSALMQFTAHAAEFPIDDFYYGKTDIWYERSIPITDTYSINIIDYFSAQLSGVQFSGGLSYKIF